MANRPSVLLLINTFDMGGAERVYIEVARGLASLGYRVTAACLQRRSGIVERELAGWPVRILDLGMSGPDPAVIWRLRSHLRHERTSIVYTFLLYSHLIGRTAARLARVPVVVSSQQVMSWEGRTAKALNRLTARWCTAVVGVSESVHEYLAREVGIPREKLTTIYNCVDLNRFKGITGGQASRHVIGSVARLSPEKDHTTLLLAVDQLRRRFPDVRLLLAGDGPERPRLEALCHDLGLDPVVEFLGHVTEVTSLYARLNVYVQPSHVEGFSVSVLEAQSCGLPIVAAHVGGTGETVVDEETGLLVPPRDPLALAAALERLLDDSDTACRMGERGRRLVARKFSAETMVQETDQLFGRLLTSRVTCRKSDD